MKKLVLSSIALMMSAGVAFATTGEMGHASQHREGKSKMHHHFKGKKSDLPRGFENLNLTDAQKAKIKAIVEADRETKPTPRTKPNADIQAKMKNHQEQMQQIMNSKTFNETAARQMIAERQAQHQQNRIQMEREHAERELKMLKKRHAIYQVLTPAQQKQLQEQQQKRMSDMHKKMQEKMQKSQTK